MKTFNEFLIEKQATGITRYYHGSDKPLRPGTVLVPEKGVGMHKNIMFDKLEKTFERYRPTNCISRQSCIYMCKSPQDVKRAGGGQRYVYEVKPVGRVDESDQAWWGMSTVEDFNEPDVDCIKKYWDGVRYSDQAGMKTFGQYITEAIETKTAKVYHGGNLSSGKKPVVTFWTPNVEMAKSYVMMTHDRYGGSPKIHEKILTIRVASWEAVKRVARLCGVDPEEYAPASVFDAELHGENTVKQWLTDYAERVTPGQS